MTQPIHHDLRQLMTDESSLFGQILGSGKDVNFPLSLIAIVITVILLFARGYYLWKHRNDPPPPPPPEPQSDTPPKPRTQEFIEKMLVLKRALWVNDDDEEVDDDAQGSNDEVNQKERKLPRVKSNLFLHEGDEESGVGTCSICLCNYENGDQICWSNNQSCTHHFHSSCAIAWMAKHSECPMCRAEYLVEPGTSGKDEDEEPRERSNSSTTSGSSSEESESSGRDEMNHV